MSSTPTTAKFESMRSAFSWTFPGAPIRINIELSLISRLRAELNQHENPVNSTPGIEFGGVLLGHQKALALEIDDYVWISPKEQSGNTYNLDPSEIEHLRSVYTSHDEKESRYSLVVGYFRTQSEDNLHLRDEEIGFVGKHFRDPTNVVLLIQTGRQPYTAGFFFWMEGGAFAPFSFMDFPLDAELLRLWAQAQASQREVETTLALASTIGEDARALMASVSRSGQEPLTAPADDAKIDLQFRSHLALSARYTILDATDDQLEEIGLSHDLVLDLVLKHTFFGGAMTLSALAQRSKLSPMIIHSMYRHLQREQLCDTRPMVGDDYEISLSSKGRNMAEVALKKGHYVGPAPVTLADYNRSVSAQALRLDLTADYLESALGDLVLSEDVIRGLGAALTTGGAILLYGSTGNGKTSIAERLPRLFDDLIYVPHAVEVSGQIMTVLDPLIHRTDGTEKEIDDPRWVRCRRPIVKVGGEMRADMLDTRTDDVIRMCHAPLQMKANNGILFIDDFGRQCITPRELLNRLIVPLDRRTDILSLWSGVRFEIAFETVVVFATNLPLSDLADDACLRRLKNKIKIDPLSQDLFKELLRRVCDEEQLPCSQEMQEYISCECLKQSRDGLRACFPTDLMKTIRGIAAFERRTPSLEKRYVDEALKVYFVAAETTGALTPAVSQSAEQK